MSRRLSTLLLRRLPLPLAALLLSACSQVQFAYNHIDWWLPFYVGSYVRLDDSQSYFLDTEIRRLQQWHCGTQLRDYAALLRSVNREIQSGALDRTRLGEHHQRIESFWAEIKRQASRTLADLLLSASDEQIAELFDEFADGNSEWLEAFREQSPEERVEAYRESMVDELERWFGDLNPWQLEQVAAWSRAFQPLGMIGYDYRRRWQERFRELIRRGRAGELEDFPGDLERLLVDSESLASAEYRRISAANTGLTLDLLQRVAARLDEAQRRHLAEMMLPLADDFDALSCADRARLTQVIPAAPAGADTVVRVR